MIVAEDGRPRRQVFLDPPGRRHRRMGVGVNALKSQSVESRCHYYQNQRRPGQGRHIPPGRRRYFQQRRPIAHSRRRYFQQRRPTVQGRRRYFQQCRPVAPSRRQPEQHPRPQQYHKGQQREKVTLKAHLETFQKQQARHDPGQQQPIPPAMPAAPVGLDGGKDNSAPSRQAQRQAQSPNRCLLKLV